MYDDVVKRLKTFGYEVTANDECLLDFLIEKTENYIKSYCNIDAVPDGLKYFAIERIVGEFLSQKKSIGQLDGIDVEKVVRSISEGDTSVTYAVGDSESALDSVISRLMTRVAQEMLAYRRLSW